MFHPDIDFQTTIDTKRREEKGCSSQGQGPPFGGGGEGVGSPRRENYRRNYVLGGSLLEEIEKENLRQQ